MTLGFYYHIALSQKNDGLYLPGFLAVFVEALAKEVGQLYLFFHKAEGNDEVLADHKLSATNIQWVDLGIKKAAWHRSLFPSVAFKMMKEHAKKCDILLVRGPSPLLPYFASFLKNQTKLAYLIVGDYKEGVAQLKTTSVRQMAIKALMLWIDRNTDVALKKGRVFVNSRLLLKKYDGIQDIHEVKTTTLSAGSFYKRVDTCNRTPIQLLYTGRIDIAKGLVELLQATSTLITSGYSVTLNIVGWEDDASKPVEKKLKQLVAEYRISDSVIFHGRKKVGAELDEMYRMADIYIIPSYHEGFPRTIWEAMANSCPVIATTVGSIPLYLNNEEQALLIEPKNTQAIVEAIIELITKSALRQRLIANAFELAQTNTLEVQASNLVSLLKEYMQKAN